MPYQSAVTIRAPIQPGEMTALAAQLQQLSAVDGLSFPQPTDVHFARLVILPEATDLSGQPIPANLVYMADVDGSEYNHLRQLAQHKADVLDSTFGRCEDYPQRRDDANRYRWLTTHRLPNDAAYVNTVGRGASQICDEARLRDEIEQFLDIHHNDLAKLAAADIHQAIWEHVLGCPDLAFAQHPAPPPPRSWRIREAVHMVVVPVVLILLIPVGIVALPVWATLLRAHERRDVFETQRPDPSQVLALREQEDEAAHNPFAAIGVVKAGWLRRLTTIAVLRAISYAARHVFNHGSLAGVTTIHFARWIFMDDFRRVVFASNYDGSLESYMDDFIDKVAWGLNAAFSNGQGYPETRWLVLDGAHDEQAFKNYLRRHQLLVQVWHSAYPGLTAINIENNAAIRLGLSSQLDERAAAKWLALL
jgi:hypothetical protein